MVKEGRVSRQSGIDLFRYGWIQEDSVSRQSSIDLLRYGWIHLPTTIAKEDGVSR